MYISPLSVSVSPSPFIPDHFNIRNTFLILSCTLLLLSEQPQSVGHGLYKVSNAFHMPTPMLPTVVLSWLDVLWVVDHSWYTWETVEKPSSVAVLDTLKPMGAWYLLPYPIQRHLNILSCLFTLWMTHIQIKSNCICHMRRIQQV